MLFSSLISFNLSIVFQVGCVYVFCLEKDVLTQKSFSLGHMTFVIKDLHSLALHKTVKFPTRYYRAVAFKRTNIIFPLFVQFCNFIEKFFHYKYIVKRHLPNISFSNSYCTILCAFYNITIKIQDCLGL